ncbi:DUF202 domain-containing protein [Streptomyces tsukubensis]|uniref:DUF202 domain-containing protein n=1 Tax=Streptomyces tsukubensis TaxID=83656 RepID=A0A1V4AFQ5_9ACTN|nr:DUF202 domain-containing protein [Streptomyces tsukubensis]OON82434.1 hypothetical protein B1H18_04635 [Streptomyces tsukubensis]QFR92811.1 DUF202 domain-containing protein [Streptomyces tsukubensis]
MTEAPDAGATPAVPPRDPGLQPERTRLAWRRTTLSCTVAAILAAKAAVAGGVGPWNITAGVCCALAWAAFLAVAQARARGLTTARPAVLSHGLALGAVLCTVALAVFAAVVIV